MKKIAIIGSTGFIGTQALQVIERHSDKFKVVALTANVNADLLVWQAEKFKPDYVGICDEKAYATVKDGVSCIVECGEQCLTHAATLDCDIVLVAVVGCVGLKSVLAAIDAGKTVALANKESLVAAGELVMRHAREKGVSVIPVDSEHSAVWQCLSCGRREDLKRLILTASGGPFYEYDKSALAHITPDEAVRHPTWRMGKKISVDSATMMNKGLEIIEARWLFDTQNIDYIIHPQSIVHSMVEFVDGAVLAQLSMPDMRLPIQLAFSYPERIESQISPLALQSLTFFPPKEHLFPLPRLAREALRLGGTAPAVLNAANEAAVALFLRGKISFLDIAAMVEQTLSRATITAYSTEEEILRLHCEIYDKLMRAYI